MPTVIDALAVTLALDPSQFNKGQKQATTAFAKTKSEAVKAGKSIEAASEKAADSLDRLARNALKLFAIFTAGRAVKDFVADITGADAALGRLAQRIGQAPSDISALATAVQRTGGSFDGAAGSFQRFSDSIQELKATGNTSILPFLYRVQAAGGKTINLNKDIAATFVDVADNLKRVNDTQGAATANYYGKQLGIDEGTVALLVQGGDAVKKYMEESRKLGSATKEDIEAAQRYQRAMAKLNQTMEGLGRSIMTTVSPMLVEAIGYMQKWIIANKAWIQTEIVDRIKAFAVYLRSIDWKAVEEGIKGFISGANDAAKAVGGWKTVAELFFGLWAASKMAALFAPILGSIATVRLALLRLGPIGWALLGVGSVGAALAEADPNKAIVSGGRPGNIPNTDSIGALPGYSGGTSDRGGSGIRRRAARSRAAVDAGRLNARAPEEAGKYRPEYKLSDADLSQRTADIIAGEAIRKNPESIDAVINNMMNRVGSSGWGPSKNLQQVATAPGQYEAAWRGSRASPSETEFIRSRIRAIASGGVPDNTNGSNAYRAGSYRGPWYRRHMDAPVIGGNRFSYESSAPNGPYAPYAKPSGAKPSAWNGYPGASDAIAATHTAQAGLVSSRTMNDNRSTSSSQATFNGGITINTAATSGDGMAAELQSSIRRRSFADAANYGQA